MFLNILIIITKYKVKVISFLQQNSTRSCYFPVTILLLNWFSSMIFDAMILTIQNQNKPGLLKSIYGINTNE